MSTGSAITVKPPDALAKRRETPAEVKAALHAAREKMKSRLVALEDELSGVRRLQEKVRETVRKHPVLTIGGMFVAGYLLGRWWGRR
ncbi:MAG: hypothetical protein JNJ54_26600 [Myxococcaceae bacterium]|nr:hypothetical protein [Myxococcaceae bacterium]